MKKHYYLLCDFLIIMRLGVNMSLIDASITSLLNGLVPANQLIYTTIGTVERGKFHADWDGGAILVTRRWGRWSDFSYTTIGAVERGKLHDDWDSAARKVTRRLGRWSEESYTTMGTVER